MKNIRSLVMLALCGIASAPVSAQDFFSELFNPLAPFPPRGGMLENQAQPRSAEGPWNNDVLVYRAQSDGTAEQIGSFERAGVPTLARLPDGRLMAAFQHFPADDSRNFDRVAVSFSADEGRFWTLPQPIVVAGMEEGLMRPFDPTLVPLPDGRVRLYFTSNRHRDFRQSAPQIYSAVSQDGVHYTFEPGVRFGIEGRVVIDCAVVLHQGVFHLYAPDNGSLEEFQQNQARHQQPPAGNGYHATSADGLAFTRVADVRIENEEQARWLGNAQSDGKAITFFGTGRGIFAATSVDGVAWRRTASFRVTGADPGAVAAKDGGWIIIATGPPRRGERRESLNERQWLADWVAERAMFDALLRH